MGKGSLGGAARTSENWRKVPAKDELSLSALRKSIPAELFKRSTAHSLGYLAFDLASLWLTYRAAAAALLLLPGWLVFPAYALMQGMNLTALWVLGHECGHGGFTDHKLLNEVVGATRIANSRNMATKELADLMDEVSSRARVR